MISRLKKSIDTYRQHFPDPWESAPLEQVRFTVLDCEATGHDPQKHSIVSIGAIAVTECQIDLGDSFEVLLPVRFNTAATLIHGITRQESHAGLPEAEALARLLAYLRDAVIVGHHIGFDIKLIDAALRRYSDTWLHNRSIDTGELILRLARDGAFDGRDQPRDLSLDGICRYFNVIPHDRHTAPGDAFLTAQVFLRLLRFGQRQGRDRVPGLLD